MNFDTSGGEVTLQGRVDKAEARTETECYARETDGVRRVINLIKVGEPS